MTAITIQRQAYALNGATTTGSRPALAEAVIDYFSKSIFYNNVCRHNATPKPYYKNDYTIILSLMSSQGQESSELISSTEIAFTSTRNLSIWLARQKCTIVVSTYSAHKIYCIGTQGDGELSVSFINTLRPMGLCAKTNSKTGTKTIYCGNLNTITVYEDFGDEDHNEFGYFDTIFMPKNINITGDIDLHDVRVGLTPEHSTETVYAISALFNSVIKMSMHKSFDVVWTPKFITMNKRKNADGSTTMIPPCEDRCHLNGLALLNGKPKYVTAASMSNHHLGWKDTHGTGVVIDVETNEIVCDGLWAPHSPNIINDRLYIGEAGTGYFGYVDIKAKKFIKKKFIPGFIRGITFYNNHAIVCTSSDRHDLAFKDLPLGDAIRESNLVPYTGFSVIDMKTYDIMHRFEFKAGVGELYDVAVMHNCTRARIIENSDIPSDKFLI